MENTIRNILQQVKDTTIQAHNLNGHFISTAQVAAIEKALGTSLTVSFSHFDPETPKALSVQDIERELIEIEISNKRSALQSAGKDKRSDINLEIQALESRRAKLLR